MTSVWEKVLKASRTRPEGLKLNDLGTLAAAKALVNVFNKYAQSGREELLKSRGEFENTLIVYSSDHGEMPGDHNMWGKTKPLQPSVGVPLVVAGPGVEKGVTSDAMVSVMDLAATYLDYAGVTRPKEMDSRSFRPVLEGKTNKHRDYLLSGLGPWRMVNDGRYKLVRGFSMEKSGGETELLFDMKNDPLENNNIAKNKPAEVARLAKLLKPV